MLDSNSQIQFLVKLLEDDDSSLRDILKKAVLEYSGDIIYNLNDGLDQIPEKSRQSFKHFLTENHFEITRSAMHQLLGTCLEDVDLEKAAIILSWWDDPQTSGEALVSQLDTLARRVQEELPLAGHPLGFIDHLNKTMSQTFGFRANSTDYYNPDNSFLGKVLLHKKGIPISISLVYLLVAKRLGLPLFGVPMPAHFIVKYDDGEDEIFFDPYARGKIYSRNDCLDYLHNANLPVPEKILNGCPNYQILLRMLNNIQLVYSSYKDNPARKKKAEELHVMVEQFFNDSFTQT